MIRYLLGVAGAPGAGKSTFAAAQAQRLAAEGTAVGVLPMDGFHLPQAELERLRSGRRGSTARSKAVPDVIEIAADIRFVIVEGNYLLYDRGGWERVRPLLDRVILLAPDDAVRRRRLIARHIAFGKAPAEAEDWVARSDDPNAELVAASAHRADDVVREGPA